MGFCVDYTRREERVNTQKIKKIFVFFRHIFLENLQDASVYHPNACFPEAGILLGNSGCSSADPNWKNPPSLPNDRVKAQGKRMTEGLHPAYNENEP